MTTYCHDTISSTTSGSLSGTITVNGKCYIKQVLNITGLATLSEFTNYAYFELSGADDNYFNIYIYSDAVVLYLSRNGGEATDEFTESTAISGNETIVVSLDSTGNAAINIDGVEVLSEVITAPWATALTAYSGDVTASGDFEVWVTDYDPLAVIQSGIITEGYGNPINIITEGYGVGSEVIPDPPTPPPSIYVVTVAAGLGGSTDVLPDTYNVISGGTFTVTATPSTGYGFLYYDDGTNRITSNPYTFTVTANVTLTPVYGISGIDPNDRFGNLVSDIMTPAICDTAQADYTRADVTVPVFDGALEGIVAKIPVETIDGVKTLPTFRQALNYLKGE